MDVVRDLALFAVFLGATYAVLASGLVVVFSALKIPNFAQGAVYAFGGYLSYLLFTDMHVSGIAGLPIVFLASGVLGVGIWYVAFRPLRSHPQIDMFVTAFGVFILLENLFLITFGPQVKTYDLVSGGSAASIVSPDRVAGIVLAALCVTGLFGFLNYTMPGKQIRAVSQNPPSAQAIGIDVNRVGLVAMFIGTALGGVAGSLIGGVVGVTPSGGTPILLKVFAILVLGGMGSVRGAVIAAFALGAVESVTSYYISEYTNIVFFGVLMLVLLVRPQGLFGEKLLGEISVK